MARRSRGGSVMSNSAARTSKNTIMLFAGTMVRMIANFGFVVFAADKLGVAGFGKYSLGVFYFELFLSLCATAVGILLTRDLAKWPKHVSELLTSSVSLAVLLAIAGTCIMLSLGLVLNYSSDTIQAINIAAIALLPASIGMVLEAALVAFERSEFVALAISIESIMRIVISVVMLATGFSMVSLFWVLILSRACQLLVYWVCVQRIAKPKVDFQWTRVRRFASRWRIFAAENWMATIYTSLDMFVLSWLAGEVAVGLYSAAWKIVRPITIVAKAYTTAVFPVLSRMYQRSREDFERLNVDTIRLMCAIALPAVIIVMVLSQRIIDLVYYSGEYAESVPVLQALIWVLLLQFLNPFLSHTLFARGRQEKSMYVAAIALAVNSVATFALVYQYGALGAAIGTVIGGLVAMCCYMFFALTKTEIGGVIGFASRALTAGLIIGATLMFFRESNWFLIGAVTLPLYLGLLWCFQVIHSGDVALVKSILFSRAAT